MKAIIWDLDGTLIDSYEVIVGSIYDGLKDLDIYIDKKVIADHVQTYSVTSFIKMISDKTGIDSDIIFDNYFKYNDQRNLQIKAIVHAKESLETLSQRNILHLMYTHKSNITFEILENLDMLKYFKEILTIDDGFKRKPDPEALNYLLNKYQLDKNEVFYVGDRSLDIESAINAGVKSILFIPENSPGTPTGKENYIIHDLLEIINI